MPAIDDHVGAGRHVAGNAVRGACAWGVAGVGCGIETAGLVALGAHRSTRRAQQAGVRIVAIRANNTARVHEALFEGLIVEDFVFHLPVILEQAGVKESGQMSVGKGMAGLPAFGEFGAPRMAVGAEFHLVADGAGNTVGGAAGGGIG